MVSTAVATSLRRVFAANERCTAVRSEEDLLDFLNAYDEAVRATVACAHVVGRELALCALHVGEIAAAARRVLGVDKAPTASEICMLVRARMEGG